MVLKIEMGYKFAYQCPNCGSQLLFAHPVFYRIPHDLIEQQKLRKRLLEEQSKSQTTETIEQQEQRRFWNALLDDINFDL